jgi:hypothetical protein
MVETVVDISLTERRRKKRVTTIQPCDERFERTGKLSDHGVAGAENRAFSFFASAT